MSAAAPDDVTPLRGRLRRLEPAAAARQTRLLAAFQNRRAGSLHLTARLASERDRLAAGAWIRFRTADGPVWLAPLLVDGDVARLSGAGRAPDAAAAAAALAPLEPLVAAVERALGRALDPDSVAASPDPEQVEPGRAALGTLIRIDAAPPGAPARHRAVLALSHGASDALPPAEEALPAAPGVRLAPTRAVVPVRVAGPVVAATRLAAIGAGDVLLLGNATFLVQLGAQGLSTRRCGLDWNRGTLTVQQVAESAMRAPDEASTGPAGGGLRVPTTIEIDGGTMSPDEATALAPGSVVSLPVAPGGTLAVRVTAGGQLVGEGELVALGQGFGVLFTSVALSATLAPPDGGERVRAADGA